MGAIEFDVPSGAAAGREVEVRRRELTRVESDCLFHGTTGDGRSLRRGEDRRRSYGVGHDRREVRGQAVVPGQVLVWSTVEDGLRSAPTRDRPAPSPGATGEDATSGPKPRESLGLA